MSAPVSPDARRIWRAVHGPAAIALVIIAVGVTVALVRGGHEGGSLDPDSVTPSGSRALARLLKAQGVRVVPVDTAAAVADALGTGATLLVTRPEWLVPEQLRPLGDRAANLVLISPDQDVLDTLLPGARVAGEAAVVDRSPRCSLADATAAGDAAMGGTVYRADGTACYPAGDAAALVQAGAVTLLGTGAPLTNERLDEAGNAALAMRLLGRHDRLVWFTPTLGDPSLRPSARSPVDLVPDGWRFGLLQVVVAVLLLAAWRARRLGPVVTEPLPVVVRAAETVEGRARLYRRAGAADHAAQALRHAALDRLVVALGLGRDAAPASVVAAVARRTDRPDAEVHALLYGPPPVDDTALVRLADALDAMEDEVRRP